MVLKKTAARRAAQQAPPSTDGGDDTQPVIECRAQQSRFWTDTLTAGIEIDLKDVSIAVGTGKDQRELLTNAHVRLKEGVRYGLVGRCGKTFIVLFGPIQAELLPSGTERENRPCSKPWPTNSSPASIRPRASYCSRRLTTPCEGILLLSMLRAKKSLSSTTSSMVTRNWLKRGSAIKVDSLRACLQISRHTDRAYFLAFSLDCRCRVNFAARDGPHRPQTRTRRPRARPCPGAADRIATVRYERQSRSRRGNRGRAGG